MRKQSIPTKWKTVCTEMGLSHGYVAASELRGIETEDWGFLFTIVARRIRRSGVVQGT